MDTIIKDVKVELDGAAMMALAGQVVTLTLAALESAGVDWKPTFEAISNLTRHEQRLLEDKAISPDKFSIPKPSGYSDEQQAVLCALLAGSIRSDREFRWNRGTAVAGVIVGVVGAIAAVLALID